MPTNSKEPDPLVDPSQHIPSFDQLRETYERLKREGRLPTLDQVLAVQEEVWKKYLADRARQAEPKPAKRKRG
jgi:hypothetical protein